MKSIKIFRTATVPISLNVLLKGQLNYLNQNYKVTAVSGGGDDLQEIAEREGVEIIPLEMQRKISPLKDFISLAKMYFLLRKEKPLIVHSITPKAGLISMLAGKFAGVPIRMHTFTGLIFPSRSGIMQKILIAMDRLLCACATNIYPEGEGVRKDLQKFNITNKPLKVLGNGNINGIDLEFFDPNLILAEEKIALKSSLNINDDDLVFIFVGRLVKDKGINELIAAYLKLSTQQSKLLLVGPLEQELDPLLPETLSVMQTNKKIISVGFQKDIRPYLAISDVFVFPSYREGFPNVVLQAGAMNLPCIVTDISGSNEIIIQNENGVIVPPKDSQALQKAMDDFISNPDKIGHMRRKSREIIAQRFEQFCIWKELLEEYQQLTYNAINK